MSPLSAQSFRIGWGGKLEVHAASSWRSCGRILWWIPAEKITNLGTCGQSVRKDERRIQSKNSRDHRRYAMPEGFQMCWGRIWESVQNQKLRQWAFSRVSRRDIPSLSICWSVRIWFSNAFLSVPVTCVFGKESGEVILSKWYRTCPLPAHLYSYDSEHTAPEATAYVSYNTWWPPQAPCSALIHYRNCWHNS